MEIEYLSKILIEIGGMCLAAACLMAVYYAGRKVGRRDAVDNILKLLQENSDETGICKIQTNMRI